MLRPSASRRASIGGGFAVAAIAAAAVAAPAVAHGSHPNTRAHRDGHRLARSRRLHPERSATALIPGDLLLATSTYEQPTIVPGVTPLPPGCSAASCVTAVAEGSFPGAFNNASVDGTFGVTSPVTLDELTPDGHRVTQIPVPADDLVTSFSSKSELALNLSPEGNYVSFMGYRSGAPVLDVSNANTPGGPDAGNPDAGPYYRVVAQLGRTGHFTYTLTNAYSGDNGRAAITNDEDGQDILYTAGNAGQSKTPPADVVVGAGAQFITPSTQSEDQQVPGTPTPLGSFNITELGDSPDKATKDDNFRAIAIENHVVYYTKGSGGNGINTVYFVDTTGTACRNGVGLPAPGAQLPTSPLAYNASTLTTTGITPDNMCILKGFPTTLAKTTSWYPFGIWFANPDTLYVADEGSGDNTYSTSTGQYTNATVAAQPHAGLEKWVFNAATQTWQLAYTLQNGLDLGQPYTIPGYPTGDNSATGLPWAPATDGLRTLTGRANANGTVTIWAVTSTVSGSGDQGADPDKLVAITDSLAATSLPAAEQFRTLQTAGFGQVLRGVSFTPGTKAGSAIR